MHWKIAIITLCVVWASVQASKIFPPPPPPFTIDPPLNTTVDPVTTTPITPTSTTAKPTTTPVTTAKPTTTPITTPKPTTTSAAPPTTASPTTPTTPSPKPTTTPIPTSTPSPSPTPKPDDKPAINDYVGNYTGQNTVCLMVTVAIQVEVLAKKNNSTLINVPKSVNYTTECSTNDHESLMVAWDTNNSASFEFFKNNSRYEIQSINVTLLLPGTNVTTNFYHTKPEFEVSDKLSYYCSRDQPLNLTNGQTNETLAKVHISHFQYQAFMNTTKVHYDSVWDCDGANTSDVVPVVVGCVLAVLVVLVLVAYLFGRRRCQTRGYLSM